MQQHAKSLGMAVLVFLTGIAVGVFAVRVIETPTEPASLSAYYEARADRREILRDPHYRPCAPKNAHLTIPAFCVELVLGGKVFVFGAPDADWDSLSGLPEAVFLMGDWPDQFQGLLGLRTWTWRLGRSAPLQVFGGSGLADIITGLEYASVFGDAGMVVVADGRLDFTNAPLVAMPIPQADEGWQTLLDTGDVRIHGQVLVSPAGAERPVYWVRYGDTLDIVLADCGARPAGDPLRGLDYYMTSAVDVGALETHVEESWEIVENARARAFADIYRACLLRSDEVPSRETVGAGSIHTLALLPFGDTPPARADMSMFEFVPLIDDGVPLQQDPVLPISPPSGQ